MRFKSVTVLPTTRDRCNISSERSYVARRRNEAKMGTADLLHASVQYIECNERFDLSRQNLQIKTIVIFFNEYPLARSWQVIYNTSHFIGICRKLHLYQYEHSPLADLIMVSNDKKCVCF